MIKARNKGYTIEIDLSQNGNEKYKGYFAECTYRYDQRNQNKYLLSMWLKKTGIDNKFKIDSQKIDTQYVSGTKETIRNNVCRIVEQAIKNNFFDFYIDNYEYTYNCFQKGKLNMEDE